MTTDALDQIEWEQQAIGAAPLPSAMPSVALEPVWHEESETSSPQSAAVAVERRRWRRNPFTRAGSVAPRRFGAAWFGLAFVLSALACLLLFTAVALGLSSFYANRVLPGVRVGSVDVSGMSRDQVIAKLQSAYAYLGQGEVTVTTPVGTATISYQQAGREPDVEVMADAAMTVGHTGNPIGDAAWVIRSALDGQSVPVVVGLDPMAVATRVHALVGTTTTPPQDAHATIDGGWFSMSPSTTGYGIDEKAISGDIVDRLTRADAPADLQAGGSFVALDPQVSDRDAEDAIAAAQKMIVDVHLVWGGVLPAGQSPAASPTPLPTQTFTIDAGTIRGWIVFGTKTDGSYGPAVDPALVQAYLWQISPKVEIPPVEPWVIFDSTGKPVDLKSGKDGIGIDVAATSQAVEAYLDSLVSGGNPGSTIAIVPGPIHPRITLDSLSGLVLMGQGTWTTIFYPDISNNNGVNIRLPASLLNGQVVGPGQQFSFLNAVGPIDRAHGYGLGGVIQGGKSNHTGAMGGGICSASTTMFNAAARAGLQIDERHAHFYYIDRYPVGLDATVYSDGSTTWDLKWTNDTPNPILIRASTTRGTKSSITIELWSLPLDRKVEFSPAFKANLLQPGRSTEYTTTLPPGKSGWKEVPTAGYDTYRTRTVTDSTGKVIHTDTWYSHYHVVNGILLIGYSPAPAPTPAPPGEPTPAPPPAATPTPVPAPRRREVQQRPT